MKITIIGLGLIGGSIAKSLSRSGKHQIIGFDADEDVMLEAISLGAISRKGNINDLKDSSVVYVCLYPEECVRFIEANSMYFGSGTLVTDVCGVKRPVYEPIKRIADEAGFQYTGSHPMAGKEKSGFYESDGGLFYGASYIIVGDEQDKVLSGLAAEMGFGRVVHTTAEYHDEMIAFTSQVPHVIACAYVKSPRCAGHKGFSAGSYRDVSRVADINSALWADLFLSNRKALVDELDCLLDNISNIKELISKGDREKLCEFLQESGNLKKELG